MTGTVDDLILDLVEWVGLKERTYSETMSQWGTSCPRFPIWEDATELGLVERFYLDGASLVRATSAGLALLKEKRPYACEASQQND